jgi:large subunit ribosomal protein L9
MDVILLDHIEDLGLVGQTVKVKDGYARNYLLPRKLACLATQKNLNFYKGLIEAKQRKLAKARGAAEIQARELSSVELTFVRKSRDQDARLFGSVTNADVAESLAAQGFEFERRKVSLSEPVKRLGEYTATIKVHPEVTATIKIVVSPEVPSKDGAGQ